MSLYLSAVTSMIRGVFFFHGLSLYGKFCILDSMYIIDSSVSSKFDCNIIL